MLADSQRNSQENSPIRLPGHITPGLSPLMTNDQSTVYMNPSNASSRIAVNEEIVKKAFQL